MTKRKARVIPFPLSSDERLSRIETELQRLAGSIEELKIVVRNHPDVELWSRAVIQRLDLFFEMHKMVDVLIQNRPARGQGQVRRRDTPGKKPR